MKQIFKCTIYISAIFLLSNCNNAENQNNKEDEKDTLLTKQDLNILTPPGECKILSNKDAIIIPFEFFGMNPLVHAKINGKNVKLLIDNGRLWDETWFYNGEVDSLNLQYTDKEAGFVTGAGEDGGSEIREGNKVDIAFEDIVFEKQPTLISVPEAGYDKFFPGVNGQISSMLFKHFVVKFDFDKNIIVLTKPENYKYSGCCKFEP